MGNFLTTVTTSLKRTAGNASLAVKKNSPEILLAAGIVAGVATVVLACKETLKAEEILDKHKERMDDIHEAKELAEAEPEEYSYTDEEVRKETTVAYIKTAGAFVKLYAPAIICGAVSVGCILAGHNILRKRYLGVVAAYETLDTAFKAYRKRVVEELGEEADKQFLHGSKKEKIEVEDENGKKTKQEVEVFDKDDNMPSPYAKFFDESCPDWKKDPELNLIYLRALQNQMTDILRSRGHLFLNEVYDALQIPRTKAGAVVGWKLGMGDDYVDFGLYSGYDRSNDFVNGYERSILLDFNVAGLIYDKL